MKNSNLTFPALLIMFLAASFGMQIWIHHLMKFEKFDGFIIPNYIFNFTLTLISFFVILKLKAKRSNQLGFVFLGSSMLKFILFLVLIRPNYNLESGIKSLEFATFFVPYAVSTALEVVYLIRLLRD